ncbi:lantibiotic dehydratase [Pedobacter sp. WC2423]|uniref:lantibiotic dehydratase n=1 Tax=Pedobacter sp. WC2423 TaxID=3234142 RepID=UPI0034673428
MKYAKGVSSFKTLILRSPVSSLNAIPKIPESEKEIDDFVRTLFDDIFFRESIFIASPELFREWRDLYKNAQTVQKKNKLNKSIIKYYIRSVSKCVPFGLFSFYSINNSLANPGATGENDFVKYLTVDSKFIVNVLKELCEFELVKKVLIYFPNNTIYTIGDTLRYIEAKPDQNSRNHGLTSIEYDEVINLILEASIKGLHKKELVDLLLDNIEAITVTEAEEFIADLIDSQLLSSSLNIQLNGKPLFFQLLNFFAENAILFDSDPILKNWGEAFNSISDKIKQIENNFTTDNIPVYEQIFEILKKNEIPFESKHLLGVNLKKKQVRTDQKIVTEDEKILFQAINLLSLFGTKIPDKKLSSERNIAEFKKAFLNRYDQKEIPLMRALDNELGIGYIRSQIDSAQFSNLIDEFNFPGTSSDYEKIFIEPGFDKFWVNHIVKAIKNGDHSIDLKKTILPEYTFNEQKLKGTFYVIYNKIGDKINITSSGGTSATNLISRFSSQDKEMQDFMDEILQAEEQIFQDKIVCEITHLPNNRAGNVLSRAVNRKYELPILSHESEHAITIPLNDLMLAVRNNKLVIRSIKHNKEVVPFLSSAQNFHSDSLPVYHFLCDLQNQYRPNILSLDFNSIINSYFNFIPRITFDDTLILSAALWQFRMPEIAHLLDNKQCFTFEKFKLLISEYKIPKYISLIEDGEESLILDTENEYMLIFLNQVLKKEKRIKFRECLYDIEKNQHSNEYLMSFKSENSKASDFSLPDRQMSDIAHKFTPGNEWLYFRLYTGLSTADKILVDVIKPLTQELLNNGIIDQWFFIRYADPDFHLRVRFHFNDPEKKAAILNLFNTHIDNYLKNDYVWKVEIATYEREIERYGAGSIDQCEKLFFHDSEMILGLLDQLKKQKEEQLIWLFSFKSIDDLLNAFGLSTTEKHLLVDKAYNYFAKEFEIDSTFKKQLAVKFRNTEAQIEQVINDKNSTCALLIEKRNETLIALADDFSGFNKNRLFDLLSSFMHMNINRAIKSSARMHEVVIYSLLEKYYKSVIGKHKHYSPVQESSI